MPETSCLNEMTRTDEMNTGQMGRVYPGTTCLAEILDAQDGDDDWMPEPCMQEKTRTNGMNTGWVASYDLPTWRKSTRVTEPAGPPETTCTWEITLADRMNTGPRGPFVSHDLPLRRYSTLRTDTTTGQETPPRTSQAYDPHPHSSTDTYSVRNFGSPLDCQSLEIISHL